MRTRKPRNSIPSVAFSRKSLYLYADVFRIKRSVFQPKSVYLKLDTQPPRSIRLNKE